MGLASLTPYLTLWRSANITYRFRRSAATVFARFCRNTLVRMAVTRFCRFLSCLGDRQATDPLQDTYRPDTGHYRTRPLQVTTGSLQTRYRHAYGVRTRHGDGTRRNAKYGLRQRITGMGTETRWRIGILGSTHYVPLGSTQRIGYRPTVCVPT